MLLEWFVKYEPSKIGVSWTGLLLVHSRERSLEACWFGAVWRKCSSASDSLCSQTTKREKGQKNQKKEIKLFEAGTKIFDAAFHQKA